MLRYEIASEADLTNLAPWLVEICGNPENHCLHTWSGESADALRHQLGKYMAEGELVYILGRRDSRIEATMGCEYDEGLGRGWLHGPHIGTEPWDEVAGELFTTLASAIPRAITTLDAYLNLANERGLCFYRRRGFEQVAGVSHEYRMASSGKPCETSTPHGPIQPSQETSFLDLYHELFPNAYYAGSRILEMIGTSHKVFGVPDRGEVVGFVVAATDESRTAGEIQFVGVRSTHRGKGYGRSLLLSGVEWLFESAGVSEISLNVRDDLAGPRRLYESVGFELRFTGLGLRRQI